MLILKRPHVVLADRPQEISGKASLLLVSLLSGTHVFYVPITCKTLY